MAKRMKFVHTPDMVAHLWAHQTQPSARNSGRGNFYFEGATIYSYGRHFPIARHADANTILFTTRGYSNTTARHIGDVRRAIPDSKRVFLVHNPCAESTAYHRDNHDAMLAGIENLKSAFAGSRLHKKSSLEHWLGAIKHANAYAKYFKLGRKPVKLTVTVVMRKAVKLSEEKRKQHEADVEARRVERNARFQREYAEQARLLAEAEEQWKKDREAVWAAWLRGERPTSALKDRGERPVMLRAMHQRKVGDETGPHTVVVETTLGAIVPLEDVRKAYVIWQLCVRKGQAWHRNGEQIKVGDFQLDSISETGNVIAGCHKIHREEIERFAATQGWKD
jgi:hypothetical protein